MRKTQIAMTGVSAFLIALGGCHKKPGGQVVAVINGEEITQQELNTELRNAHVPDSVDHKKVMPLLLQRVIERTLLDQLATKDGLDKTPAFLDEERAMHDNLLATDYAAKVSKTITMPDPAVVDAYIAQNPTVFGARKRYTLAQIVFPQPSDPSLIKKLEPVHTLDAIAAVLNAAQVPFVRGVGKLDTAAVPAVIANKIAGLPAGEPFLLPDNGRIVASVVQSVEAVPMPADQAKPAATNLLRQKALSDALRQKVDAARTSATISYAPGFAPPPGAVPTPTPAAH